MSILVKNSKSGIIASIEDGITSATYSVKLIGRGADNYLQSIQENLYALLETGVSETAPTNPMVGQLWYALKGSNTIEVLGSGLNNNKTPYIKINGTNILSNTNFRGIALVVLNELGQKVSETIFDTYGVDGDRTALATALTKLSDDDIFIMVSKDAIGTNKALNTAMQSLGSTVWYRIDRSWRFPYAAIGIKKIGIQNEIIKSAESTELPATFSLSYDKLSLKGGFGAWCVYNSNCLLFWTGTRWMSDTPSLGGKTKTQIKAFILAGLDLSKKFDKSGGAITGGITITGDLTIKGNILPNGNEIQYFGNQNNRFRYLRLSENASIIMGTKGYSFNKNSFVYTVNKETSSTTFVPAGSLILNQETGEAVVKRVSFVSSSTNNTFRGLAEDKLNSAIIGVPSNSYFGETGVFMGGAGHGKIETIKISTIANSVTFGTGRTGGYSAGCSDESRGLSFFQNGGGNYIQYISISSAGNAIDFGMTSNGAGSSAVSDGVTAIVMGGTYTPTTMNYVKFTTPMSGTSFASLQFNSYYAGAASSGIVGVLDGGYSNRSSNYFQKITIMSSQNSVSFGNMSVSRHAATATSNYVRGIWFGGIVPNGNVSATMDYITFASPSNSISFGNLSTATSFAGSVSNGNRAVVGGGSTSATQYVSFSTAANSVAFGTLSQTFTAPASFSGN